MDHATDSPIICSRKRDAKHGAMPRSPSLLAMIPSSSASTGCPCVDSTPLTLNLLQLGPALENIGPECRAAGRAAGMELAVALHTVLLVYFALVFFRKTNGCSVAALILFTLALSHPAVVYVVRRCYRWYHGADFASDLLPQHAVCANADCVRRIMQQGQAVYLAYDTAFCSARCRSKWTESAPSGDV